MCCCPTRETLILGGGFLDRCTGPRRAPTFVTAAGPECGGLLNLPALFVLTTFHIF